MLASAGSAGLAHLTCVSIFNKRNSVIARLHKLFARLKETSSFARHQCHSKHQTASLATWLVRADRAGRQQIEHDRSGAGIS